MKQRLAIVGAVVLTLALVGCKGMLPYSETSLTGTIAGVEFAFVDGYIDADGSIEMFDEAKDFSTFSSWTSTYPQIIFSVPEVAVAEYKLQFKLLDLENSFTITGLPEAGSNYIFTEGNVEITEVTTTTVSGRMHITYDPDELDGTFTLERVSW